MARRVLGQRRPRRKQEWQSPFMLPEAEDWVTPSKVAAIEGWYVDRFGLWHGVRIVQAFNRVSDFQLEVLRQIWRILILCCCCAWVVSVRLKPRGLFSFEVLKVYGSLPTGRKSRLSPIDSTLQAWWKLRQGRRLRASPNLS